MGLCYASLVYSPLNPCSVCLSVYLTAAHFFSNSHTHFLSKIYHNIIVSYEVFSSIYLYLLLRLIKSLVSLLLPHTTSFFPPPHFSPFYTLPFYTHPLPPPLLSSSFPSLTFILLITSSSHSSIPLCILYFHPSSSSSPHRLSLAIFSFHFFSHHLSPSMAVYEHVCISVFVCVPVRICSFVSAQTAINTRVLTYFSSSPRTIPRHRYRKQSPIPTSKPINDNICHTRRTY